MYDPKFSVKEMYDQYGSSRSTPASRSAAAGKQAADTMRSAGVRGIGARPVTFPDRDDDRGSTYDYVPQTITTGLGGVRSTAPVEPEKKSIFTRAFDFFKSFGAEEPKEVKTKSGNVYDGPMFTPYVPDTSNFGDDSREDLTPDILKGAGFAIYRDLNPDQVPLLKPVDNPTLNMFGVRRGSTRSPDAVMTPPSIETPANMDPMTRMLSQAMLPEPTKPTADYKTQVGDTLFSIQKTLKENGINTTVEEIAEINDIGLDGIFGIKPGTELKLPMPSKDFKPKEVKAALEKLTPITMEEEKSLAEQLAEYTKYMKNKAAETLGIDVETDESKIETAVGLASKQYKVKKGDTLSKIARKNNTTLSEILKANPNIDPDTISIGQTIKLPQAGSATETPSDIKTIQVPDGNLKISTGTRSDHPTGLRISLDYNSAANPNAKGTLVVIPDNASRAVRDAAEKFNDLVVQFAASKGYEDYKNRGVRTRSENKRGVSNTIHVEPFFQQDSKMEQIINENFAEFAKLYTEAFGGIDANMIAPHGNINAKGIQDKGATSKVFGTELDFGNRLIKELMDN